MPAPLSLDIRRRFQRCIEDGLSGREAARRLMISPATGARLAKRVRSGVPITAAKCGRPTGWGKLGSCKAFLLEVVRQDPDITLRELQGALAEAEGELIIRVFGVALDEVREWQNRALDRMCPILIIDALRVKIRNADSRTVKNKAVYVALGVTRDGLDLWIAEQVFRTFNALQQFVENFPEIVIHASFR